MLVGKKNLEVRPMAINKGEIVKRILYLNPDARFVFCAGDDKVRLTRQLFFLVVLTQCFLCETIDGRGHVPLVTLLRDEPTINDGATALRLSDLCRKESRASARRVAAYTRGHLHDRRRTPVQTHAGQVARDEPSRGRHGAVVACWHA